MGYPPQSPSPPILEIYFQFPLWDTPKCGDIAALDVDLSIPFMGYFISTECFAPKKRDFQFPLWDTFFVSIESYKRLKLSIPFMGYRKNPF